MRNLRVFFLSGTIVLFIILMIVGFQNFLAQCNFITFFFFPIDPQTSPTILIFLVGLLGVFTGMFIMGLLMSFLSKEEEEDEF